MKIRRDHHVSHSKRLFDLVCLVVLSCLASSAYGQNQAVQSKFSDQQIEHFESNVRPLLVEHCYQCHGPQAEPIEGGLNLATRKSMITGGDTGPAIVPGHADESLLIDAINYGDVYEMPPDTKLAEKDIATLTQWVNDGAPWPASSEIEVVEKAAFDIQARKSEHWCWHPVRSPNIPEVSDPQWPRDPIDNFILARLDQEKLTPAQPADRRVLIRRVFFDIIGLPPTPEQVQAFVDDSSETAFEQVVDELLASPQFGERWARHWMDLIRYAETGGHEFDYPIPNAFQYRDYLIRAFNADVPYKQFVHEHIAGDLLPNPRRHPTDDYNESVLGTGFWFLGEAKHGPVDSRDEEARTIDNQIDVMSKTFMGLTVACARCHDHKFDAISAEDYYALAGFFQSSRRQDAMLDPGRKIESKVQQAAEVIERSDASATLLAKRFASTHANHTSDTPLEAGEYLDAALEILRADQQWNQVPEITAEGESLKQLSVESGETLVQEIKRRDKLAWSGDKQYWWKHGQPNDEWVLEFDVPDSTDSEFNAYGVFTLASDYGAAKISINDLVVSEKVDFYSPELTTTKIEFGSAGLKPGKNQLKIQLLEPNDKAAPSNMVGIDLIGLTSIQTPSDKERNSLKAIASERELDETILEKFVTAIKEPALKQDSHPLHLLYQASRRSQPIDQSFSSGIAKTAKTAEIAHAQFLAESEPFAKFDSGLPTGWFQTGLAFGADEPPGGLVSASGPLFRDPQALTSGKFSSNLFGVIRSPTFELKHSQIHYRIRGSNVTIRLIVNGYTMDIYNALLYSGFTINLNPSEAFAWQTQSGDIRNHIGSRAHLEIIDHGNGYFEIDEIRFSDGARAADQPDAVRQSVAGTGFQSQKDFAQLVAASLSKQLSDTGNAQFSEIASWVVKTNLADVFAGQANSIKQSSRRGGERQLQNVSLASPNAKPVATAELIDQLKTDREQLDALKSTIPHPILAIGMTDGTGEEERIFIRGNHKTLGDVATRRFLEAISNRPLNPSDGSGRLQLANKITAPNNPLTMRVMTNRIWHHLLGRGLVSSVDNFGVLGKTPTHPELLDYLTSEFAADGQSIKRMIKRIAMTRTYQMASTPNAAAEQVDPSNDLLHRARIRRLQGEAIRDSMLKVSGRLDLKMFGQPIPIYLTPFMQGRGRPGRNGPLDGDGRRSIYIEVRRNFLSPMMLAFDTPIPFNAIGKRNQSNVPAQALILMNDPFVIEQAKFWADKLITEGSDASQRIDSVYQTALGRSPSTVELEKAMAFIRMQAEEMGVAPADIPASSEVWQDFCHVIFNLKEFIFIQ